MIEIDQKERIIDKVSIILRNNFTGPKTIIRVHKDRINFACPYCGDSIDPHKKRANVYWKNLVFHCYNGGCSNNHTTLIQLLKDHGQSIDNKEDLIYFLDYIKENQTQTKPKEYLEIGIFEKMKDFSVPLSEIKAKLNLVDPKDDLKIYKYLKSRFMHTRMHNFLYDPVKEQLYIFNLTRDLNNAYGYQIRNLKGNKQKYLSYNIENLNKNIKENDIEIIDEDLHKLNTLSLYFNVSLVDFTRPTTVLEGPIDSILCNNSIALSGIDKETSMFDEISTIRYLFDNDAIGRKKMEEKLKRKKSVFMWNKLLKDFKIQHKIKDFNELIKYCWINKNDAIRHYTEYFTNNPLDLRSI